MILKHTKCTESTKKEQEEQNFFKVRLIKNFGPGIHQTLVDLNSNFIHPIIFWVNHKLLASNVDS